MGVFSGSTLSTLAAGDVLLEQVFPAARSIRLIVLLSANYPFEALLEIWNGTGQVVFDMVLPVNPPLWVSPPLGPFNLAKNGRVRVVSRNTPLVQPGPLEVQATLQITDWGER